MLKNALSDGAHVEVEAVDHSGMYLLYSNVRGYITLLQHVRVKFFMIKHVLFFRSQV